MIKKKEVNAEVFCAIYCRFSSEAQRDSMSIEAQKRACSEFAEKRGWKIHKIYIDEARSGTADDRASFQEMISEATQTNPPFQFVIVHKTDRFARNRYDSIQYKYLLRKKNIKVVAAGQPIIGSGDPTEVLLEAVLEGVDEFYSLNLARESIKGMAENARHGWFNGGWAPFGYQLVDVPGEVSRKGKHKRKLMINEVEAPIIRRIFNLCLQGHGVTQTRNILNNEGIKFRSGVPFTKNMVSNILRNEKYAGDSKFGKTINRAKRPIDLKFDPILVRDSHPAIIERERWEKAQSMIDKRLPSVTNPRVLSSDYLFAGLITCGLCGSKLVGKSAHNHQGKHYRYYICNKMDKVGPKACRQRKFNADNLEKRFIERLTERGVQMNRIKEAVVTYNHSLDRIKNSSGAEISKVKKEMENIDKKRRKLFEAIEDDDIGISKEDIAPRLKELKANRAQLEVRIQELELRREQKPVVFTEEITESWVDYYLALYKDNSFWRNKARLQSLILDARVDGSQAAIKYDPSYCEEEDIIDLAKSSGSDDDPSGLGLPTSPDNGPGNGSISKDDSFFVPTSLHPVNSGEFFKRRCGYIILQRLCVYWRYQRDRHDKIKRFPTAKLL